MTTLFDKLTQVTSIHSPSGSEFILHSFLKKQLADFSDKIEEDVLGNLIAYKYAIDKTSSKTIMLVAHMDEVAMMVSYIDNDGWIGVAKVGGVDVNIMRGQKVVILHEDREIHGVVGSIPIHMQKETPKKDLDFTDLWIDIGATSINEAERLVSVGDYVLVDSEIQSLNNHCVCAKACDNKAGIVALWELVEKLSSVSIPINLVMVFSVQEEVGLRGAKAAAYNQKPDICIAVDVAHASDYPNINAKKYGRIRLGDGPVIPLGTNFTLKIQKSMMQLAFENNIPFQRLVLPASSGTDVNAVQTERGGCQTGLISIPCRYMHSPNEVVSLCDIDYCSKLLYKYVLQC